MDEASIAIFAAIAGGAITALATGAVAYYQRKSTMAEAHRLRAFEKHLQSYETIFATCRTILDGLNDYQEIDQVVTDRSDPFLHQLLGIFRERAYEYCRAVDWRHNPGMAYLDMDLEEQCLHLRDLLLRWLSGRRTFHGDIAIVRRNGEYENISMHDLRKLKVADYQELIIERRRLVVNAPGDAKLLADIRKASVAVIRELKDVMAN